MTAFVAKRGGLYKPYAESQGEKAAVILDRFDSSLHVILPETVADKQTWGVTLFIQSLLECFDNTHLRRLMKELNRRSVGQRFWEKSLKKLRNVCICPQTISPSTSASQCLEDIDVSAGEGALVARLPTWRGTADATATTDTTSTSRTATETSI